MKKNEGNKHNPYTLMFGKEPKNIISRIVQSDEVYNTFSSDEPSQQIYMITGVRGSGKTVFMTELAKRFKKEKSWVTVELNPAVDILKDFAAKLYEDSRFKELFREAKINLSLFGIGVEISGVSPISNIEVAITRMLESIKKSNKRVLITIDEVTNTEYMKVFASAFQIFIRQDLPLFLLMTGLYENINQLQNDKMLTFLYRAPKIYLKALNIGSIASDYRKNLGVDNEESRTMARLTRGYPFAFQVLGYYSFEAGEYNETVEELFRSYLEEYVYDKIWSEMSVTDRKVLYVAARNSSGSVSEIREELDMAKNEFSPYRDRLIKRGVISGEERGYIRFTLPLFEEFVMDRYI